MPTKSNFKNPNIASFLKRNRIAVIATANKDTSAPHAAAVYYATDSQMNIFFVTKENTVKSKNLEANPQIALAIYEAPIQATAQITGTASRVNDPAMLQKALRIMAKHSRESAKTDETPISKLNAGQYVLYKIWPQTIRLGEYKYGPHNQIFDTATPAEESLE